MPSSQCRSYREFLSTPSARRATYDTICDLGDRLISIHALREEGDAAAFPGRWSGLPISIHALREEGDLSVTANTTPPNNFYPRPPRGGRQETMRAISVILSYFYPRPPRGGRPTVLFRICAVLCNFYPRPPRGGRRTAPPSVSNTMYFYPRPPRGGRLAVHVHAGLRPCISIHALREEGDSKNRDKISIFKQIIQHSARI